MKNRELIGNYFNAKGHYQSMNNFRVDAVDWSKGQNCFVAKMLIPANNHMNEISCPVLDLEPIKITEEILLKAGFKDRKLYIDLQMDQKMEAIPTQ